MAFTSTVHVPLLHVLPRIVSTCSAATSTLQGAIPYQLSVPAAQIALFNINQLQLTALSTASTTNTCPKPADSYFRNCSRRQSSPFIPSSLQLSASCSSNYVWSGALFPARCIATSSRACDGGADNGSGRAAGAASQVILNVEEEGEEEKDLSETEEADEVVAVEEFDRDLFDDDVDSAPKSSKTAPRRKSAPVDDIDPLEFYLWSKERLMRSEIGLPQGVKELMYRGMWDKLIVDVKRTVKVTKSVKLDTYHSMVCVGNYKGLVGIGVAHSRDTRAVVGDAFVQAFHNLVHIPLYRGHTVYHHVEHEFHGIKVMVMPRPQGWGIKSNDLLHELCNMIGLRDVSVKVLGKRGQRNKMNVVKCFLAALQKQSTPHDGIEATGVYAREVYAKPKLPFRLQRQGVAVSAAH